MQILGMPLFIWFGILAALTLLITATLGIRHKLKYHRKLGILTVVLVALHVLGVFGVY